MTNPLYPKLKKVSDKIIKKFGIACVCTSKGNAEYEDWMTQEDYDNAQKEVVTSGFIVKDNLSYQYEVANASMIKQGDIKLICTNDLMPKVDSEIVAGKEKFLVVNVMPIKPADVGIIHEVHARLI